MLEYTLNAHESPKKDTFRFVQVGGHETVITFPYTSLRLYCCARLLQSKICTSASSCVSVESVLSCASKDESVPANG